MNKFKFDKDNWIQRKNVLERKFLFLDTFAWTNMIRGDDPHFSKLKKILLSLVASKKILVAVDVTLISEIVERDDIEQARDILELFDTLSEGAYLINPETLFSRELEEQLISRLESGNLRKLTPSVVFGPVWETLGELSLIQRYGASDYIDPEAAQKIFGELGKMKLTDFFEIWLYQRKAFRESISEHLEKRYQKNIPSMTYQDILREEQDKLARVQVRLILAICESVLLKVYYEGLGSKEHYQRIVTQDIKQIVNSCPTFDIATRLHATVRLQKDEYQLIKIGDFHDILHLSSAIPYCDYVLCDRGMAHICRNELQLDKEYKTEIFASNEIPDLISRITN